MNAGHAVTPFASLRCAASAMRQLHSGEPPFLASPARTSGFASVPRRSASAPLTLHTAASLRPWKIGSLVSASRPQCPGYRVALPPSNAAGSPVRSTLTSGNQLER
jgi:hypothetical protein